ncbi:hypothetical protein BJ508DRAFT_358446 [Ascobolus immersus RN42]|uniref:Extracellular membrane protein CFEM domain-containing protein n=1 Tax=Ascobolus immersus RN42 TaxID=1160509 RepID=A0A3N4IJN8_ASCIM|nr:hypothetical protein BJ508DRAFT_358446 [Ascobolus immersus RN42]
MRFIIPTILLAALSAGVLARAGPTRQNSDLNVQLPIFKQSKCADFCIDPESFECMPGLEKVNKGDCATCCEVAETIPAVMQVTEQHAQPCADFCMDPDLFVCMPGMEKVENGDCSTCCEKKETSEYVKSGQEEECADFCLLPFLFDCMPGMQKVKKGVKPGDQADDVSTHSPTTWEV